MKKKSVDNTQNKEKQINQEMFSREAIKQRGFGRFLKSFGYSMDGLAYSYKNEQSMLIHLIITILVVILNIVFQVSAVEWLISFLAIGMVLAAELINTAVEAVVDLVTLEIHPLAKIAKDCTSAATFVLSIMAGVMGLIVYVPYIMELLGL